MKPKMNILVVIKKVYMYIYMYISKIFVSHAVGDPIFQCAYSE